MHTVQRLAGVAATGVLIAAALAGCGAAPWDSDGGSAASPTATAPAPVSNDLSSGATQRVLVAGAVTATIDYWSTLSMDRWTPDAIKPVSLSMTTTVEPADGQKVFLQRASMVAVPSSEDGTLPPLEAQNDTASVSPGYLVLSPYSYSQTFNVGPVDDEATSVTLQITYDFLVQTTPTSNEYSKQTATDTLTVALNG